MPIRRATLGLLAVVLGLALTSPAVAADQTVKPEYLYVFDGANATLTPITGKAGSFDFVVPIRRGNHLVTWFTDRPVRDAGQITMRSFAGQWTATFKTDPPNVAVTYGKRTMIAIMTNARIVGTGTNGQALRSTLTLIEKTRLAELAKGKALLSAHAKRAGTNDHRGAKTIPSVSVFVDLTMNKSASQH